jgi:hypothetical protein
MDEQARETKREFNYFYDSFCQQKREIEKRGEEGKFKADWA